MDKPILAEVRDQVLHAVAAVIVLGPALHWRTILAVAFSGFCAGSVRELTQNQYATTGWSAAIKRTYTTAGSGLDLCFWTLGAAGLALALGFPLL